jgi:peroxiredoxin
MPEEKDVNRLYWFVALLFSIILVLGGIVFHLIKQKRMLENQLTSLAIGQSIDYFDVVNVKEEVMDASLINNGRSSLIFIFSRPCSPCNANIIFWNRMARICEGKANVFGIVIDDLEQVSQLSENKKVGFDLYVPAKIETFINKNRIDSNQAQTVLYKDGEIDSIVVGELDGDSYTQLMRKLKKL